MKGIVKSILCIVLIMHNCLFLRAEEPQEPQEIITGERTTVAARAHKKSCGLLMNRSYGPYGLCVIIYVLQSIFCFEGAKSHLLL